MTCRPQPPPCPPPPGKGHLVKYNAFLGPGGGAAHETIHAYVSILPLSFLLGGAIGEAVAATVADEGGRGGDGSIDWGRVVTEDGGVFGDGGVSVSVD